MAAGAAAGFGATRAAAGCTAVVVLRAVTGAGGVGDVSRAKSARIESQPERSNNPNPMPRVRVAKDPIVIRIREVPA